MVKLIGMIMIIGGFGFWGLDRARDKRMRVVELSNLGLGLTILRKEILYLQTPLYQALREASSSVAGEVGSFFARWGQTLREYPDMTAAEALQKYKRFLPSHLGSEDRELFMVLAREIGLSPVKEQERLLLYAEKRCKDLEEAARKEMEKGVRLWTYGGFLTGITVVLLLI